LLQQARGQQALAALNSVQNRQRELHSLQESVVELAQLYKQLEQMISDQDVAFQEIEASVFRAENDIEKGHGEVTIALTHGLSARKVTTSLWDSRGFYFGTLKNRLTQYFLYYLALSSRKSGFALVLLSYFWSLSLSLL